MLDALITVNTSPNFNYAISYKGMRSLGKYINVRSNNSNFKLAFLIKDKSQAVGFDPSKKVADIALENYDDFNTLDGQLGDGDLGITISKGLLSIKDNLTLSSPYDKSWIGLYQDVNSCDYAEPSGGWFWIDTDDNKDPTNTNLNQNPLLEVTKTATVTDSNSNGLNDAGDIIVYTITLENKGNVTLSSPTFNEYLIDGEGTNITSALVGPTYN